MSHPVKLKLLILVICVLLEEFSSECIQSYVVLCDDLSDLAAYNDTSNWSKIVIGGCGIKPTEFPNNHKSSDLAPLNKNANFRSLTIVGQITSDGPLALNQAGQLRVLNFYGNNFNSFHGLFFTPTRRLDELSLTNNNISSLNGDESNPLPHPNSLWFVNTRLLDLSHNKLTELEEGVMIMSNNYGPDIVDLSYNQLVYIGPRNFRQNLKVLNLNHNRLTTISDEVFKYNQQNLRELSISHNSLVEMPDLRKMKALEYVDFACNKISRLRNTIFGPNNIIRQINLSKNRIVGIENDTFNHMEYLSELDLSNNRLKVFHLNAFILTEFNGRVDLSFNRFLRIRYDANATGDSFPILSLYGNPWKCRCWEEFERDIVKNHVTVYDHQYFSNNTLPYCYQETKDDACVNYETDYYEASEFRENSGTSPGFQNFIKTVSKLNNGTCL